MMAVDGGKNERLGGGLWPLVNPWVSGHVSLCLPLVATTLRRVALCGLALLFCLGISSADAANDDQYCSQWTFGQIGQGANSVTNIAQDNGWQVRISGFRLSPDGSIEGDARAVTAIGAGETLTGNFKGRIEPGTAQPKIHLEVAWENTANHQKSTGIYEAQIARVPINTSPPAYDFAYVDTENWSTTNPNVKVHWHVNPARPVCTSWGPGAADVQGYCKAYAAAAVTTQQAATGAACGFGASGRWSANEQEHYNACMGWGGSAVKNGDSETNARTQGLSACQAKRLGVAPNAALTSGAQEAQSVGAFCANYGGAASLQFSEAKDLNCGFTGDRWTSASWVGVEGGFTGTCYQAWGTNPPLAGRTAAVETNTRELDLLACKQRQQHNAAAASAPNETMMVGTDMPGSDYRNVALNDNNAVTCANLCKPDGKCLAWTWVKPGAQNPKAMCWLKNAVPPTRPNPNATSGIKATNGRVH
jgi:hypothetical protein